MYGTGCLSGACHDPGDYSLKTDTSVPLTRWDNFIDQAIAKATWTGTGKDLEKKNTYTWGTAAAPEITVINNSSTVSWNAKVNGAGVLIIESPGPTQNLVFSNSGELNWQGLVIIRSPGEVQFEIENSTGRVRVFGQVVNRAAAKAEIEIHGSDKNFIKYSSAALGLVRQLFFAFRSWQEVVTQ